jgi:hypothetical protein
MKPIPCPRCNGSGVIEETQTLSGIAPLLDRPSVVNDEEWTFAGRDSDMGPTVVTNVPTFKLPERPKPPFKAHPLSNETEMPTRVRQPPRRSFLVTTVVTLLAMVIGVAVGGVSVLHRDTIIPWVQHIQHSLRGRP